ncbi:LOW QUALITY PROTEIN: hypothetical protein MAR_027745 [Mya arenaria]|uniref:Uncharacterized protein n=1 Tax=Mya arenaria TaxID=6604 RepID=A0ABY7EUC4_MYAAR|nr:LOW QUALITY PROTEIN: hypothetical protein MAR_027745 [Mya arenaria]
MANVLSDVYKSDSLLNDTGLLSTTNTSMFDNGNSTFQPVENKIDKESEVDKMLKLVPEVMKQLADAGVSAKMFAFFKQVHSGIFSLDKIAFGTENAVDMPYSSITKVFWKLGFRHFGARFINFMVQAVWSNCCWRNQQRKSANWKLNINFAVPSVNVLQVNFSDENPSKPGIFVDVIETLANSMKDKYCCITFDGIKLKQGLTKTESDIDRLGFEKDISLKDKRVMYEHMLKPMNDIIESLKEAENIDLRSLTDEGKTG